MKNLWSFFAFPFPVVPAGSPGTGKSILLIYKKNTFPFPVVPGKKTKIGKSIYRCFYWDFNNFPTSRAFPITT